VFFAEWKNYVHPVGDIALQRNYKWKTAATYTPYVRENPLGALSDIHQPQVFSAGTISVDIIP
jgi:hypothetical protein